MSLSRVSCWEILELEQTTDRKSIKRAYHKLLRKKRPDEKPDEFKILYQAYQDALEYKAEQEYSAEESTPVYEENVYEHRAYKEKEEVFTSDYQERLDEFIKKVNERTYQNSYIKLFNELSSWDFIEELQIDQDIELYEEASFYLFEAVTEFEKRFPKELLNMEVILYLNNFFLWKKQWQKYDKNSAIFEYLYSYNALQKIMPNDYPLATLTQRIFAFSIDMGFIALVMFLLEERVTFFNISAFYIILQLLTLWLFNLPSFGNFLLKLKIFEGHDKTEATMTARGIRISLLVIVFFSLFTLIESFSLDFFSGISVISLGLALRYNKMLQDFSGTRIYDMSEFVKD